MRHIIFADDDKLSIAVLIKGTSFNQHQLQETYIKPLFNKGVNQGIAAYTLKYREDNKAPVGFIKTYLNELLPVLDSVGTKYLYVADANYFKVLTKERKAEPHYGYVLPCKYPGYEHMHVVLGTNYQALIYNPDLQSNIDLSINALANHINGTYVELGNDIIHSCHYPKDIHEIAQALNRLHDYPLLSADIETFSLRFNEAGIGTIGFSWDEHNGIAFPVDYQEYQNQQNNPPFHGEYIINTDRRKIIKQFLTSYQGTIIWHNAAFDIKCLIYALWMEHPQDIKGLLEGLDIMTRHVEDTRIIAYLATNNTAGNVLGLKGLAHEFAGNWAVDEIKDIRKVPLKDLLQYNLVDCLSTFFIYKKYLPIMQKDDQETLYRDLMLPTLKVIIQMELVGLPMCPVTLKQAKKELEQIEQDTLKAIMSSSVIDTLNLRLQTKAMEDANAKLKVKQHPLEHFKDVVFNPGSGLQKRELLYSLMGLPVIDRTMTGLPATGEKTLIKLINHTDNPEYKKLIQSLIDYSQVTKILSTFISAFEAGLDKADGRKYLHGNFNIGGTVSGRLSSSDPNLQNLPANSSYASTIKRIVQAAKGWLFCGADFNSLEDMVNALLTKDPNKLKVYTDGYNGHSLRAFAYFREQMPDIEETVESINSIEDKYPELRQESKAPTFACTYLGTWRTMVKNLGWSEEKAKEVEARYHELYAQSTAWVKERIADASRMGYAVGAFGLRIRTPLLAQVYLGHRTTPKEAEAEARTLGNAISGQSYGLLNNRAAVEFMNKVWSSKYRYDILPVALIHDAIYLLVRDDAEIVEWVNRELIKAMQWQELPEIAHDTVKLGAELEIYYPSWDNPIKLPNNATRQEIQQICSQEIEKLKEAA